VRLSTIRGSLLARSDTRLLPSRGPHGRPLDPGHRACQCRSRRANIARKRECPRIRSDRCLRADDTDVGSPGAANITYWIAFTLIRRVCPCGGVAPPARRAATSAKRHAPLCCPTAGSTTESRARRSLTPRPSPGKGPRRICRTRTSRTLTGRGVGQRPRPAENRMQPSTHGGQRWHHPRPFLARAVGDALPLRRERSYPWCRPSIGTLRQYFAPFPVGNVICGS